MPYFHVIDISTTILYLRQIKSCHKAAISTLVIHYSHAQHCDAHNAHNAKWVEKSLNPCDLIKFYNVLCILLHQPYSNSHNIMYYVCVILHHSGIDMGFRVRVGEHIRSRSGCFFFFFASVSEWKCIVSVLCLCVCQW